MSSFFQGKVAIVTGAGSGIGKALAYDLVKEGAFVVLVARGRESLEKVASELGGGRTLICPADVTKPLEIKAMVEEVIKKYQNIDILINCAGTFKTGGLGDLSMDIFKDTLNVNLAGTINCIKEVLPHMKSRKSGEIVILSSLGGRVAFPGYAAYSASKFALYGFANTVRPELKKAGLNLLAVYPSFVDSPLVEGQLESVKESLFFRLTRGYSPEKVSRAILKGIRKKKRELILPKSLTGTVYLYGLFPGLVEIFMGLLHGGWPDINNNDN